MPAEFPPAARLRRPSEFAQALKGRRAARGAMFVLMRAQGPAGSPARLGLIVSKRHAPLSVTRNAIKRVLREAFRQRRSDLPEGDLVFRLVGPPPAGSLRAIKRQARAEADRLLARLQ